MTPPSAAVNAAGRTPWWTACCASSRERHADGQRVQREDREVQPACAEQHSRKLVDRSPTMGHEPFEREVAETEQPQLLRGNRCAEDLGPVARCPTVACRVDHAACDRARVVPAEQAALPHDEDECGDGRGQRHPHDHRGGREGTHEAGQQPELSFGAGAEIEQILVLDRERGRVAHDLRFEMVDSRPDRHGGAHDVADLAVDARVQPVAERDDQRLQHLVEREQRAHHDQRHGHRAQPRARLGGRHDPPHQPRHADGRQCRQDRRDEHRGGDRGASRRRHHPQEPQQPQSVADERADPRAPPGTPVTGRFHAVTLSIDRSSVNGILALCGTPAAGADRMATVVTRKEQAARSRPRLVDTARELFVEQGYDATPVSQILGAAGMAQRGPLPLLPQGQRAAVPGDHRRGRRGPAPRVRGDPGDRHLAGRTDPCRVRPAAAARDRSHLRPHRAHRGRGRVPGRVDHGSEFVLLQDTLQPRGGSP